MSTRFRDRQDAATRLAKLLRTYAGQSGVLVVALSNGGVVIGRVIADTLRVPLTNAITDACAGKIIILVDDGIATTRPMLEAIARAKACNPKKIIVAVVIAPPETIEPVRREVDEMVVLHMPLSFVAVDEFFGVFPKISDEQVQELIRK